MAEQLTVEAVVQMINQVRRDPPAFIPSLQKRLDTYKDMNYSDATGGTFKSVDGPEAVREAIAALQSCPSLQELKVDGLMNDCAKGHCDYLSLKGSIEHIGEGGTTIGRRLDKFGIWTGKISETISVQAITPEDVLIKWLIDDGIKSRGHRKAILEPQFKKVGVGISLSHKTFKTFVVAMFAINFGAKDSPDAPLPEENQKILDEIPEELKKIPEGCQTVTVTKRVMWEGEKSTVKYYAKYNMKDGSVIERESEKSGPGAARVVPKKPWPKAYEPPLPFLEQLKKPASQPGAASGSTIGANAGFNMPNAPIGSNVNTQFAVQGSTV